MLSLILKPLFKNIDEEIELPSDTEIALSMIESGCIFVPLHQKAALIIISDSEDIMNLKNINNVTMSFELIERPEFPSLGMHIEATTVSNKSYNFDYFFNTDSPGELELLSKLREQKDFDILFYDNEIVHSKKIEFSEKDKSELRSLIDKVLQ